MDSYDRRIVWTYWRIALDAEGGTRARPVVLLHGGCGSWNHWVSNVVPLDMPFGGNDGDAMIEPLYSGLLALTQRLRWHSSCVDLVGFSFGGMVAVCWLQRIPIAWAAWCWLRPPP